MYLSRITLAPVRETYRILGDIHALHRLVMRGFPPAAGEPARATYGVLFRVELTGPQQPVPVLVQSAVEPRWPRELPAGVQEIAGPRSLEGLLQRLVPGERFRFRLRANPTRRVHARATREADVGRGRQRPEQEVACGKRVAVHGEERRIAWLARQGEQHGFRVVAVRLERGQVPNVAIVGQVRGEYWVGAKREDGGARHRIVLDTVLYEGVLEVTGAEALRQAVARGIGPGKAFGCGLLSLAPLGPAG
jgi:CRISPR system Cascade subunit CasE